MADRMARSRKTSLLSLRICKYLIFFHQKPSKWMYLVYFQCLVWLFVAKKGFLKIQGGGYNMAEPKWYLRCALMLLLATLVVTNIILLLYALVVTFLEQNLKLSKNTLFQWVRPIPSNWWRHNYVILRHRNVERLILVWCPLFYGLELTARHH